MAKSYTEKEFKQVEKEYRSLLDKFKPAFGNLTHISIVKRVGRIKMDEALVQKHLGKKLWSPYQKKVYEGMKAIIPIIKNNIQ